MKPAVTLLLAALAVSAPGAVAIDEVRGLLQFTQVAADGQPTFIDGGTGVLRWDDPGLYAQQAVLSVSHEMGAGLSGEVVANLYQDGEQHVGISQAVLNWKPLSAAPTRFKGRAGLFYPRMSLENSDTGWLSPFTYTPSAINSWLGEELRVAGAELSLFSPGRARRSPWSWELTGAVYGGNDPLGSLISWRGFAMHDRQSLHHDRVLFAEYPSVIDREGIWSPAWVEPFREVDQRLGYYVGAHLQHGARTDLRLYYYDNNAEPTALNSDRIYAWDTRFTSLAFRHNVTRDLRLLGQWMTGSSDMGDSIVGIGFDSAYLMASQRFGATRISARYDWWDVAEDDLKPEDPNDNDGEALTVALRHDIDTHWQVGVEAVWLESTSANRPSLGLPATDEQQQWQLVLQYRFGD